MAQLHLEVVAEIVTEIVTVLVYLTEGSALYITVIQPH